MDRAALVAEVEKAEKNLEAAKENLKALQKRLVRWLLVDNPCGGFE